MVLVGGSLEAVVVLVGGSLEAVVVGGMVVGGSLGWLWVVRLSVGMDVV